MVCKPYGTLVGLCILFVIQSCKWMGIAWRIRPLFGLAKTDG